LYLSLFYAEGALRYFWIGVHMVVNAVLFSTPERFFPQTSRSTIPPDEC